MHGAPVHGWKAPPVAGANGSVAIGEDLLEERRRVGVANPDVVSVPHQQANLGSSPTD